MIKHLLVKQNVSARSNMGSHLKVMLKETGKRSNIMLFNHDVGQNV